MGILTWVVLAALLFQTVFVPVISCDHPRQNCPPSHVNPPSHGGGGYGTPPSHGGGGGCGHSGGGGGCGSAPPSHGVTQPPAHGGGGYYSPPTIRPPSTPVPVTPVPVTPVPVTPVIPTPIVPVTPTPIVPVTPTPIVPVTPSPLFPTPTPFDPNIFPGTCDFWRTHPTVIWGILGYWAPVCGLLGMPSSSSIFGGNPSVLQALACPRLDGYGALLREGTASLLNSMATTKFPFTTQQVRDGFLSGLTSEKVAGTQAQRFRMANEGHLRKKN